MPLVRRLVRLIWGDQLAVLAAATGAAAVRGHRLPALADAA